MPPTPAVTLIAAVSDDGFISPGRGIPWDLPADRAHFRARTLGKWLLLGRRTYEEMTGWFHNHKPLVLSNDASFKPVIGTRVTTVAEALARVAAAGADELMVIGGGQVFAAAMAVATRLDLTRVHTKLGSGVPFPAVQASAWQEMTARTHPADAAHQLSFTFTEWERMLGNGSDP